MWLTESVRLEPRARRLAYFIPELSEPLSGSSARTERRRPDEDGKTTPPHCGDAVFATDEPPKRSGVQTDLLKERRLADLQTRAASKRRGKDTKCHILYAQCACLKGRLF